MSWTEVFPVLIDQAVGCFEAKATADERRYLFTLFDVNSIHNQRLGARHLVATSLFWKRDALWQGELPPISRQSMRDAQELGLVGRYDPWETYFMPIIRGAKILRDSKPDAVLRVYLANDLRFLLDDLVDEGCEVYLMVSSSIRHNPGGMWRFLAMEGASCPVTVTDSDRLDSILSDLARTDAAQKAGVGSWRVPYYYDSGGNDEGYRPLNAAQFGSCHSYPMLLLMQAFVWHNLRGTMPTRCRLEGLRESEVAGTRWPDYGFDEWFLLSVMYPRMAQEGMLTFVPWDLPPLGQFFTLDIEYCTWANPGSELINYPNPENALGGTIRPWAEWKDEFRVRVRSKTLPVHRERIQIGPVQKILNRSQSGGIVGFSKYAGDFSSFLAGAGANVAEPWFIDLNPQLHLSSNVGELFLDRRYGYCDVVFCGYYFIKITRVIAAWARCNDLDEKSWGEGKLLKVPKLEGPMTLWKTEFSRKFYEDLVTQPPPVKAEILLRAWMDQGKVVTAETTAKQMGWKVR